ncbi:MAG: helix-turn-helix domain-containing protein [Oscillospiraceae bacterium]|nr:helix-turn-helix domain-containing protein [Oscillospiraceae bacterium]
MKFPDRLKQLRTQYNISQKQLAQILSMNIRSMSKYETEYMEPTLSVLLALADYFDVSLDYLVGRTDNPNSHKN